MAGGVAGDVGELDELGLGLAGEALVFIVRHACYYEL